jgi:hypothetical protein
MSKEVYTGEQQMTEVRFEQERGSPWPCARFFF